ncbi:MAG: YIP1 family protein, partial [Acidiferrobacterales bacterium]
PPVFAYIGAMNFGWRLGVVEPLLFPWYVTLGISLAYFGALLFGFLSAAFVARWMASTYSADVSLGVYFGLIAVVGAPLMVGSVMHLYPQVFLNLLVLVPALIWSMYLLYTGLPVVLKTGPERGMLMASAIIGYLLVASVSLLGVTVMLWRHGIGPRMGI